MKFDADFLTQKKKEIPFKIKGAHIQHKEIDSNSRIIKAVVNTLNFFDYDFDALATGVANRSINNNGAKSSAPDKIAHLLHHDMHRAVGKSQSESEETIDGKKVLLAESFLPETQDGDDTLTKYETGIYNQHSIGFKYTNLTYMEKGTDAWKDWMKELINPEDAEDVGYGWKVSEINWWEYSTVVFGANKLTPYLGTKSENKSDIAAVISEKMTILAYKAMRRDIKNKKLFEYELSQLKQMVFELAENDSQKPFTPGNEDSEGKGTQKLKFSGLSSKIQIIN